MEKCAKALSEWGKEITGSFRKRIDQSKRIIRRSKGRRDEFSVEQFREENKKLAETLTQHEVSWKQRAKQMWLKEGDQNNKYFHSMAKARRKMNHISFLIDEDGRKVDWDTGLQEDNGKIF